MAQEETKEWPRFGDTYYYISFWLEDPCMEIETKTFRGTLPDRYRHLVGNMFEELEKAHDFMEKIIHHSIS